MPPVGFESTIPGTARPQTYALDRAATGIGFMHFSLSENNPYLFGLSSNLLLWASVQVSTVLPQELAVLL
jgi:hypothetical protein